MQAAKSRVVGLVALEPSPPKWSNDTDAGPLAGQRLHGPNHHSATRNRLAWADPDLPTQLVHADTKVLMLDLKAELHAFWARLDGVATDTV